jgi:hypothetical protein
MCPMQNQLPDKNPRPRTLTARLDRAARDMNAFLLVLAIGLATLDLTCLWAFKMRDALPGMTRNSANAAAGMSKPAQHVKPVPNGNPAAAAGSG